LPQPNEVMGRPWHKYQHEPLGRLLEPGYPGSLDDAELAYIQEKLKNDAALRLWWGMRPGWKRIPEEVVRRIALEGHPDDQAHNRNLARPRKRSLAVAYNAPARPQKPYEEREEIVPGPIR
jgi:hypothetical protein